MLFYLLFYSTLLLVSKLSLSISYFGDILFIHATVYKESLEWSYAICASPRNISNEIIDCKKVSVFRELKEISHKC